MTTHMAMATSMRMSTISMRKSVSTKPWRVTAIRRATPPVTRMLTGMATRMD